MTSLLMCCFLALRFSITNAKKERKKTTKVLLKALKLTPYSSMTQSPSSHSENAQGFSQGTINTTCYLHSSSTQQSYPILEPIVLDTIHTYSTHIGSLTFPTEDLEAETSRGGECPTSALVIKMLDI